MFLAHRTGHNSAKQHGQCGVNHCTVGTACFASVGSAGACQQRSCDGELVVSSACNMAKRPMFCSVACWQLRGPPSYDERRRKTRDLLVFGSGGVSYYVLRLGWSNFCSAGKAVQLPASTTCRPRTDGGSLVVETRGSSVCVVCVRVAWYIIPVCRGMSPSCFRCFFLKHSFGMVSIRF